MITLKAVDNTIFVITLSGFYNITKSKNLCYLKQLI